MGAICTGDGSKDEDNIPAKDRIYKDFQKEGNSWWEQDQYPQAAFNYFQYKKYTLSGEEFKKFDEAVEKAGDEWTTFATFLEERTAIGITSKDAKGFDHTTTWGEVLQEWENNPKEAGIAM